MTGAGNPVEGGFIESLAHPGGNVTGVTNLNRELGGKRLELLKEAVPKLARVAVLYDPAVRGSALEVKEIPPSGGACARVDYSVKEARFYPAAKSI
jgi:putative ABC transport system substrate-binding protein